MANKPGFANRKESTDSGISDFSSNYSSRKSSWDHSRKSSSLSTVSSSSRSEFMSSMEGESSILDDVKEEEPYEEPDDELCEKIVTQVEFYFSDANITKDKFLLKVRFHYAYSKIIDLIIYILKISSSRYSL